MLGAHMPTAGGLQNALLLGKAIGCEAVQLFVKSPAQWEGKPLTDADIEHFHEVRKQTGINVTICHDAYLINLAASDKTILRRSRKAFIDELNRCALLGIPYLVTHMGSHGGKGEEEGLKRLAESLALVVEHIDSCSLAALKPCSPEALQPCSPMILLETTAGQGSSLGYRFEHIAWVLEAIGNDKRLGVCLDTCHVFAAGYDLRSEQSYSATFWEFDKVIGLSRLKVIHANDSKKPLGSRIDRHEHIGKGFIGKEAFRLLVNDPSFKRVPKIVETPDSHLHKLNLQRLRRLIR